MIGECIRMLWGECRNCSEIEMQHVASVYWNRIETNGFNSPEVDFLGLQKPMKVLKNAIDKEAFEKVCTVAIKTQSKKYRIENHMQNIYFFNLSGNKPKCNMKLRKFKKPFFKHTFYKKTLF